MSKQFTSEWLRDYEQRILKRQQQFASHDSRLRATEPERSKRRPLVNPLPGEAKSGNGAQQCPSGRFRVTFRVYAVRPLDWDNYRLKDLQDCLVRIKFLPSDDYQTLEGQVISCKAHSKAEEKTIVTIERLR